MYVFTFEAVERTSMCHVIINGYNMCVTDADNNLEYIILTVSLYLKHKCVDDNPSPG